MKKLLVMLAMAVSAAVLANPIDDVCPEHVLWGAPQIAKEGNNQYLCRNGYAVNYNYRTKVAYYAVEHVIGVNVATKTVERTDIFRDDSSIPEPYRSSVKDYLNSGFDRGHLAPAGDFVNSAPAMRDSFLMSNMMPQLPANNRGVWKYLEDLTRYWAGKYGDVYVITGPVFDPAKPRIIGNGVQVPSHVYKIIIDPKQRKFIAFLIPNSRIDPNDLPKYVISVAELEAITKINFSPKIPTKTKKFEKIPAVYQEW